MSNVIKFTDKKQINSSKPVLLFVSDDEQEFFEDTEYVTPDTHFSTKDKVSNLTWNSLNRDSTFKSESKFYKNLKATYTGRLINFSVVGNLSFDVTYSVNDEEVVEHKTVAQVWKILDTPILYQYAKDKGQISAVPMNLLTTSKKKDKQTALNRGDHTDELASFLSREVDTMKKTTKSKKYYSHIILLERIYKIDGIDDVQQDINSANKKKKRTRDKLAKILSRFQENEMIKGRRFHKKVIGKSSTFYSVEILI